MICIGQKYFQKALELLHNVVTSPMPSINTIAVEAFKTNILVSLIQNRLPYMQLASSYSTGKVLELETCI
ncbi:26S PROTEASOME NON-ATPASE REGULATORY SUBUNIT 3/COP9 SIGNALOSOME COMPLEX SUBUNIT 3 [Salix purpurea]|uniref:26S PROTEASOME NON-ATPASE REGULATORY SUBUNIT 3/COP9 SIGNALOSOME COMPLEX SUBUNIT 3 n=1 Tax=Salix purpurea TaxID=77065 RepID=A0A9Q0V2M6_SALPP|nr:26S PROTEASOME NON-ATPASE REGULATORY SUBUNIT 3/COP9 SIGNALOSOME COMPLEX SUBUNIT 3 [Salix purpurea]